MSDDAATPVSKPPVSTRRPSGLGRGLSALLGEIQAEPAVAVTIGPVSDGGQPVPQGIRMVPVTSMRPMPNQPRKTFNEGALEELAISIVARGMLQPIVVRDMDGHYEIIAGERRWRAAQIAQIHQVPVIVKDFDDRTALELAMIENIQREQLNAWEEGEGYRRLIDDLGYTQETLAKIVGKSRSHIANLMRLGNLPQSVHGWLAAGEMTMGHARALLGSNDPLVHAKNVIAKGLSVRQTEALVRKASKGDSKPRAPKTATGNDADITALERQLSDLLGLRTEIKHEQRHGSVTLHYSSLEQLDMICQRLSGEPI
jgi:ParB family transcriptional regulator, chromosome partitioning protein